MQSIGKGQIRFPSMKTNGICRHSTYHFSTHTAAQKKVFTSFSLVSSLVFSNNNNIDNYHTSSSTSFEINEYMDFFANLSTRLNRIVCLVARYIWVYLFDCPTVSQAKASSRESEKKFSHDDKRTMRQQREKRVECDDMPCQSVL